MARYWRLYTVTLTLPYMPPRRLLTEEEFAAIVKGSKAEIIDALRQFVARRSGRPTTGEAMTGAERVRAYRERQREAAARAERSKKKPRKNDGE